MTIFYHESKAEALAAGEDFSTHFHVRAELEPYNGWVIVLTPLNQEFLQWPLAPILKRAEIDLSGSSRLRARPEGHISAPKAASSPKSSSGSSEGAPRPSGGATARVHSIADEMHKETPLTRADRARVIEACEAAGINKSTAATQWSKWARNNNL